MTPAEHRAKAEELREQAERIEVPHRPTPATRDRLVAEAQLHATLGLTTDCNDRCYGEPCVHRADRPSDLMARSKNDLIDEVLRLRTSLRWLTSEPALAAFREAWAQADAEGATGDRVRRGMVAAIEAVS